MEKYNKELYQKWVNDSATRKKIPPMTNTQSRFAKFLFEEASAKHLSSIGHLDDVYLSIRRFLKP